MAAPFFVFRMKAADVDICRPRILFKGARVFSSVGQEPFRLLTKPLLWYQNAITIPHICGAAPIKNRGVKRPRGTEVGLRILLYRDFQPRFLLPGGGSTADIFTAVPSEGQLRLDPDVFLSIDGPWRWPSLIPPGGISPPPNGISSCLKPPGKPPSPPPGGPSRPPGKRPWNPLVSISCHCAPMDIFCPGWAVMPYISGGASVNGILSS